jgi:hypothetical protein
MIMNKKLGVFLIRGAGKEGSKEQQKFVGKLNLHLKAIGINPELIHYEYANWYEPTQINEDELFNRLFHSGYTLKNRALRKFILFLVSDLVAYIGEPNRPGNAYLQTHERIHQSILNLKAELEEDAPLIIIASSLATEIISNYIRDRQIAQNQDPCGLSSFERMETLTGIFMFGNMGPVYMASRPIDLTEPFTFPPLKLPERLKPFVYWGNFYDKNDPMGFPLRSINAFFKERVTEDVEINSGGWLLSWNAGSHLGYWKSRKIRKRVAAYIKNILA